MSTVDVAALVRPDDGALSMWVIYDRPLDHPSGPIARRWEISKGHAGPTADTLVGDLSTLRDRFAAAGLHALRRSAGDDRCIVETWI